ncbi:hypothetical protein AMATHDRAFT_49970 [Amanita thiersii Skay4041]|uniref:Uncharacterized protein n=1 Tax=Amanita thiersii Skay4041 TaxID=703135 RepID=A0A2A9NJH6_9AGAR|nr:hypothetical protein AMATHDRAFT_49970 [Amanita thiersii Skay4041]
MSVELRDVMVCNWDETDICTLLLHPHLSYIDTGMMAALQTSSNNNSQQEKCELQRASRLRGGASDAGEDSSISRPCCEHGGECCECIVATTGICCAGCAV